MKAQPGTVSPSAKEQLRTFIEKFGPADQRLIRAVRSAIRKRLPTANELVWDNYNFFVIGYSPTDRPSDSIISIAARANGVGLCFIRGATLSDPQKVLQGSGARLGSYVLSQLICWRVLRSKRSSLPRPIRPKCPCRRLERVS